MKRIIKTWGSVLAIFVIVISATAVISPETVQGALTKYGLPGIYNSSALSLSDGSGVALAVDSQGRVILSTTSIFSVSGGVTGNWYPSANNVYNLGTGSSSWKNIYASGTAYLNSITVGSGGCVAKSGFVTPSAKAAYAGLLYASPFT